MILYHSQTTLRAFFFRLLFSAILTGVQAIEGYAQATLVKDINTTPASISPYRFCKCGPYLYFSAYQEDTGTELWRSDGTTQGTEMVTDLSPGNSSGAYDQEFGCLNGSLLFQGSNPMEGSELWKTDGTAGGTVLLKAIIPGSASGVLGNFIEYNGKVFFLAKDPSSGAPTLWTTDGTSEGTTLILTLGTIPGTAIRSGHYDGGFYFLITRGDMDDLWRSDGTASGTTIVKSSPWLYDALGIHDKIFFAESINGTQYLMVSDGTAGNYAQVKSFTSGFPQRFYAFQDKLIFMANGIYVSDGTDAGTIQLLTGSIQAGSVFNNKFFGIGRYGDDSNFLFSTDGTVSGSQNVMELGKGSLMTGAIPILNDKMIITSFDETYGLEPRLTDGTINGTTLLKDIAPGITSSIPSTFEKMDDKVIFLASNGTHGKEVWQTDGTVAGTTLLKDVNTGTESSCLSGTLMTVGTSNNFLFLADKEELGPRNLWQSDGTEAGTNMYHDFGGYANFLGTMANGDLVFFDNRRLIRSNGEPNGTHVVKDFSAEIGSFYSLGFSHPYFILNGKFLFYFGTSSQYLNYGGELWTTDGTDAGTFMVKDIKPGAGSSMQNVHGAVLQNRLVFAADDGTAGSELWITDGSNSETRLLIDLRPGPEGSGPSAFAFYKNEAYFAADDGINGPAIWKTDGTASGTMMIKTFSSPGDPIPRSLTAAGDMLVFSAWDDGNGWAMWGSDGTTAGTYMIKDMNPSEDKSFTIGSYVFLNNLIYFPANDGEHGMELWISDGTTNGTFSIDLEAGIANSNPASFSEVQGIVYFSAAGKLWKTDGSAENTVVASELRPLGKVVYKDPWIYFIGTSDEYGTEPFKFRHADFSTTALANYEDSGIRLFPNPASQAVQITSTINEDVSVTVIDLRGRVLSTFLLGANAMVTHDVSKYAPGVYVARVNSKRGVTNRKFLKK